MLAVGLHRALERAGVPLVGVSIGREADRATWRCHFAPQATEAQRTQAADILAGYDLNTDTVLPQELADRALALKVMGSLARVTWENLPASKPSWADFLARWKAVYLAQG